MPIHIFDKWWSDSLTLKSHLTLLCRNFSGIIKESFQGIAHSPLHLLLTRHTTRPSFPATKMERLPPAAPVPRPARPRTRGPAIEKIAPRFATAPASSGSRNPREVPTTPRGPTLPLLRLPRPAPSQKANVLMPNTGRRRSRSPRRRPTVSRE